MLGLRCSFYRDLSPQFESQSEPLSADGDPHALSRNPNESRTRWNILGGFDYLRIAGIKGLSDVGSLEPSPTDTLDVATGGRVDLILFPNPRKPVERSDEPPITEVLNLIGTDTDLAKLTPPRGRFLFFLRITLSSVGLDKTSTYEEVLDVIDASEQWLTSRATALLSRELQKTFSCYWALGGPDLVAFCCPESVEHFSELNNYISAVRFTPLSAICPRIGEHACHAFAAAHGSFAYRDYESLHKYVESEPFKQAEQKHKIRFLSRVAVGAGHESLFKDRLPNRIRSYQQLPVCSTWGHRSLYLSLEHLSDVMETRRLEAWDESGQRRNDFESSRTVMTFDGAPVPLTGNEELSLEHPPIRLDAEISSLLNDIELQISRFGGQFLGHIQFQELRKTFLTFRTAFQRNERVGAVRDLLPFFRQLAACLGRESDWYRLFNDEAETDPFVEPVATAMTSLLAHLWRALRNRVEHRVQALDPSFPNTLDYGASRLVNAYTVVAWLCWDLFTAKKPAGSTHCSAENFAACVCAGISGRVDCHELFTFLRERLEDSTSSPLTRRASQQWSAPLLLLSISGPVLTKPELALVLCLHEMAEFSHWIELEAGVEWKLELNKWQWWQYCRWLGERLGRSSKYFGSHVSIGDPDERMILLSYVVAQCTASHPSHAAEEFEPAKLQETIDDICKTTHPLEFLPLLNSTVLSVATTEFLAKLNLLNISNTECDVKNNFAWHGDLARILDQELRAYGRKDTTCLYEKEILPTLAESCRKMSLRLTEIIADIGMWTSLTAISQEIGPEIGTPDAPSEHDLDRMFLAMLETLVACSPPNAGRETAAEFIMVRWALQYRAIKPREKDWKARFYRSAEEKWSEHYARLGNMPISSASFLNAMQALTDEANFFDVAPASTDESLIGVLRKFAEYDRRGESSSRFIFPAQDSPERLLLKQFYNLWCKSRNEGIAVSHIERERLNFIVQLWAKAQRFCVSGVFKLSENETGGQVNT